MNDVTTIEGALIAADASLDPPRLDDAMSIACRTLAAEVRRLSTEVRVLQALVKELPT